MLDQDPKALAQEIVKRHQAEQESEGGDSEDGDSGGEGLSVGMLQASQDMISAFEAKDHKALARHLHGFVRRAMLDD